MLEIWRSNILNNLLLVEENKGPELVMVVSGSESDRKYWKERFSLTTNDVFRINGNTSVVSVSEKKRKGNFLGTFNAWANTKQEFETSKANLPQIALMSMVFGKGKRMSPFTQALGNRKPAFPTPRKASIASVYLNTAELSNLYTNLWIQHLKESGFHGVVVKWGDEAIIPGIAWGLKHRNYSRVDAIRFVWQTEITENLAREKEWVVVDAQTGLMKFQYSRQEVNSLEQRLSRFDLSKHQVGVNLGSLAISYEFLDTAVKVLHEDIIDPNKWADWDPYVWIALCCRDESQWRSEAEYELSIGKTDIQDLEARYPDFYAKITALRNNLESKLGRPFAVGVLDFGNALWTDIGLHISLRKSLESLTEETESGKAYREIFGIPHDRDKKGNIIINSSIPKSADIRNSVIVDSIIQDSGSVINKGVIVGGQHIHLHMPHGGSALFCAVDRLTFIGPHGIALGSIGSRITVGQGERHTTLSLPQGIMDMISSEAILDYDGENYSQPILRNRLSFEEAGELMSRIKAQDLEKRWMNTWRSHGD